MKTIENKCDRPDGGQGPFYAFRVAVAKADFDFQQSFKVDEPGFRPFFVAAGRPEHGNPSSPRRTSDRHDTQ